LTDQEDGFRERKVRPEGWMQQAIADGTIADPEALEHPTAAELAGALHTLNTGWGDPDAVEEATTLLTSVPMYVLQQDDEGVYALVHIQAITGPGVFRPPMAHMTSVDEE
jgi:hypothetical protein